MEIGIAFTVSTGQIERIPKTQAVLTKLHTSRTYWSGTGFLTSWLTMGVRYHTAVAQPHR